MASDEKLEKHTKAKALYDRLLSAAKKALCEDCLVLPPVIEREPAGAPPEPLKLGSLMDGYDSPEERIARTFELMG